MPLVHVPAIPEQRLNDLTQTFPSHKQGFPNCRGPIAKFLRSKEYILLGRGRLLLEMPQRTAPEVPANSQENPGEDPRAQHPESPKQIGDGIHDDCPAKERL